MIRTTAVKYVRIVCGPLSVVRCPLFLTTNSHAKEMGYSLWSRFAPGVAWVTGHYARWRSLSRVTGSLSSTGDQ